MQTKGKCVKINEQEFLIVGEASKKMLVLIRGLPGSGKSTYPNNLEDVIHLEADMYFCQNNGSYEFDREKLRKAHDWCFQSTKIFMFSNAKSVVVSNTFTTFKEMKPYLKFAIMNEFPVWVYTLLNNYGSIHNVPEETMTAMRNRFESQEHIMEKIKNGF